MCVKPTLWRGSRFAFVDFLTKKEAKSAFEALSTSTHLYGRRIVVEWAEVRLCTQTQTKYFIFHFRLYQMWVILGLWYLRTAVTWVPNRLTVDPCRMIARSKGSN